MADDASTVEAGWYEDPGQRGQLRWWDGTSWTEHTSPDPNQQPGAGLTPPPGAPPAATAGYPPGAGGYPSSGAYPTSAGGFGATATSELATPGQRLGAYALDLVFYVVVFFGVAFIGMSIEAILGGFGEVLSMLLILAMFLAFLAYPWLYPAKYGQTLGKHLVGIEIRRERDGATAIGGGAAFGRELVKGLGAYVLLLGILWILFDDRQQGWHDKAVSTVVTRSSRPKLSPLDFLMQPFRG